tara:strand:+ start:21 stop:440 length:420 start_codon:yes stop_codon:yes gene_type:complete
MIQTPLDKKTSKFETTTFVDLDFNFKTYSNLDVKTKLGENAIKQSIKNILMVDRYEKPFQPNFGAGLQDLLFENISPTSATTLETLIEGALNNYEPRIFLESVSVFANEDRHRYDIIINFSMIQAETSKSVEFFLERIR